MSSQVQSSKTQLVDVVLPSRPVGLRLQSSHPTYSQSTPRRPADPPRPNSKMAQLGPERGSLAAQTQAAFRAANFVPVMPEGRASWASRERRWAVNRLRAVRGGSDVRQTRFRPKCHVTTLASGTAVSAARKTQSPRPSSASRERLSNRRANDCPQPQQCRGPLAPPSDIRAFREA